MKRGDQSDAHSASRTGPKSGVTSLTVPFNTIVKDCVRCSRAGPSVAPARVPWTSISPTANIIKNVSMVSCYDIVIYDIVKVDYSGSFFYRAESDDRKPCPKHFGWKEKLNCLLLEWFWVRCQLVTSTS